LKFGNSRTGLQRRPRDRFADPLREPTPLVLTQMPIDPRVESICLEYGAEILATQPEWGNLAVWLGDLDNESCSWIFEAIDALPGGHPWSYSCDPSVAREVILSAEKPLPPRLQNHPRD